MAITTDSYYDIIKDDVTLDRIGLSKTLNNYTIVEIADYAFVGSYSQCGKQIMPKSLPGWTYVGYSQDHGSCPFSASFHSGTFDRIDIEDGLTEDYNLTENGIYRKVVLLHDTTGTYPFNLTTSSLANMKIITEFDAPKYTIDFGSKTDMLTSESGNHYWRPYEQSSKYNTHLGYNDNVQISTCGFQAYIIIEYNNTYYFIMANVINKIFTDGLFKAFNINNSNISECANQIVDYQNSNPAGIAETVTQWFSNYDFTGDNTTPINQYLFADTEYWNDYDGYCSVILFHNKGFRQVFNFTEEYNLLLFIAGCYGIHFIVDGTVYKPIISDNFVTGYTDDLNVASDLDGYTGSTKHDLPVTPPRPTPPPTPDNPWDVDAETYGWGGNEVGGMVRYYLLTSTEMDKLVSAMGSSANWVIDYLNNIVSCFIVPNNGLFFDAAVPTTVKFRVDNKKEWDTGVSCKRISGVVNKSGGTIEIPRCTNSFLDFEPYSDYSIYIPFCGRIPIKGNIVCGREITVTYYPDVPTCSLTAVVTCGNSTVAIAKGQYGSMIPVTSSGADRKTAAAISDVSSIITGLGIGIAGAASGNAGLLVAGGSQLVGGLLNTAKDSVQSYAYSSGSSGDTSFFAAGTRCQYYINYLQLDPVVNSSEFGHTVGYLCKEIGMLRNYHGFTICANPHVHISATSTEKEEIKRLLEEGVILP